ncbi:MULTISPECIES: aldo/keto reductase [Paenarthrobacter]|jgi:2,5-diketo-D-gluconate reductase A|uniref:aldo/keto reductase n=1 Tax=Paenarthrobacter TaxID=1742992 RepID=UPI00140C253E|nr:MULTISPECIES: aldo/keto reductase [Paenarthrobacter]MCW3768110.1 aldo/keto reductase [Paenarthrobacter sp. PAE-2]MCX8455378.1 aldo/keto reductase [Paenarthrobacter ureafaciens]MCY0973436.1 aldo/keto reductase [Paenarthrobacter ureafaciens]QOT18201.1 aldo/keto reductase [Paenarthrobacter sp. YJN-5]QQQ62967.1 aldo/keto reductase [Paenarthrobacter ureafaciens]
MTSSPTLTFNDGNTIPQLGYGVWQVEDDVAEKVVRQAFEAGFRHIDTAKIYGNESGVGRAIASSGLSAEEIFITTKLWNADQGYESTLAAFEDSMDRLGLETLDLYLIHWMQPKQDKYVDTWKALIELQKRGRVKSIGVSNFSIEGLQRLIDETGVVPAIHQVELHPFFNQSELRAFDASQGILTQAWSPLGQGGELLENATIAEIAAKHHATPAQVVIAWHLAIGNVVIPKSVTESRIQENFAALSVKLDEADVEAINGLDRGAEGRIGPDPAVSDFA